MSKVNLKDNIWIEGFNNILSVHDYETWYNEDELYNVLFSGKTSEISEEVAKECVYIRPYVNTYLRYDKSGHLFSAKESIKSACPEEYCIVYKTK